MTAPGAKRDTGEARQQATFHFGRLPRRWFSAICRWRTASNVSPAILNPCGYCVRLPSSGPIPYRSQVVIMLGTSSWQLRDGEQIIACNTSLLGRSYFLIGITRVRNENW